ncbi:MAG: hypothetical protein IKI42_06420, partial [Clostridia bacterium]|nr:hypothetical protein [Clostridia bacterium]
MAIAFCLPRCPERVVHQRSRSFFRILAHFYPTVFVFLDKKCDNRFFVQFYAHFSVCVEHGRHQLCSITSLWTAFPS